MTSSATDTLPSTTQALESRVKRRACSAITVELFSSAFDCVVITVELSSTVCDSRVIVAELLASAVCACIIASVRAE